MGGVALKHQQSMNTIDLERLATRGKATEKLWAMVLWLAVKDGATRVWYGSTRGEERLGYEVAGKEYAMVPPPGSLEPILLQDIRELMQRRSMWKRLTGLFREAREPPTQVEGQFLIQVESHKTVVSATVQQQKASVMLRLTPEVNAGPAAQALLGKVLGRVINSVFRRKSRAGRPGC
jgi:hypothetical protein